MPFLANCTPEVIESLHSHHNEVLCKRLEHYIQTHNHNKVTKVVNFLNEEDLRYREAIKDK